MPFKNTSSRWAGFRSVLCAIDFSEQSRLALRYAASVALRGHASLSVTYVNDPLLVAAAAAALHDQDMAKQSATELRAFVAATLSADSSRRVRLKSDVSIGRPADEIMKAAVRRRSDLVVLGTHGLTGSERLVIGSTTLNILQRTRLPVLAIPRSDHDLANVQSWPGERIVAALDLDADAPRTVEGAARVAQWFGASLLLLHVVREIAAPAWLTRDLSAHDRIRVARAQQQIDTLAESVQGRVETSTRVICGRVADEIAAFAAAERIGLVMTTLGVDKGWLGSRRGAVSYHVLSHAVAPVLAFPPRWRPR